LGVETTQFFNGDRYEKGNRTLHFRSSLYITAFSAPFAPTVLTIDAPAYIAYQFDGSSLSIPVSVSGTPAGAFFLVFTKGKASSISKVQNGYLGWHYMNNIDTCIYLSSIKKMETGPNTIAWDGKDKNGKAAAKGEYSYYIWGFDNVSPKVKMTRAIMLGWESRDFIQTHSVMAKL